MSDVPSSSLPTSNDRANTPRSPYPRLFGTTPSSSSSSTSKGDLREPPSSTIEVNEQQQQSVIPKPSDLMTTEDYRRIQSKALRKGFVNGMMGGCAAAYSVHLFLRRFYPVTPNTLFMTFFVTSSGLTWATSTRIIQSEVDAVRQRAKAVAVSTSGQSSTSKSVSTPTPTSQIQISGQVTDFGTGLETRGTPAQESVFLPDQQEPPRKEPARSRWFW
ncbi:hypothetical protein BCR39DRAFT_543193 [Naematelia encephala]|uniref:Uncharacterized protein n=1 Tax=Naematelia encephala TaxID=71784 RepID=A0A1Y2AT44_9TREE|nr:hypothetical protein BCR39DRAFT_543193 [Naematelia encephala]